LRLGAADGLYFPPTRGGHDEASRHLVPIVLPLPGLPTLELQLLLLDVNGTLSERGSLIDGVADRLARLRGLVDVQLVSADTFGTLDAIAQALAVGASRVGAGEAKLELLDRLGRERCVVIGNGANDALALDAAALGIAVIGPEGASTAAVRSADVVCTSITDALDLLVDVDALAATLRR
jgi:soluble P-type ATPase